MLALLIVAVFLGLTVWGIFSPGLASWVFIAVFLAYTGWVLLSNAGYASRRLRGLDYDTFDSAQLALLQKHPMYFYSPLIAQNYASVFSAINFMCTAWLFWLLWHKLAWPAGAMVVVFFVASRMPPRINPGLFLRYHAARGKLPPNMLVVLETLESVENVILRARGIG